MFYGDNRRGENPLEFLTNFEIGLSQLPHLSESVKCKRFYNHCKLDFDAEDWYENIKKNSPAVVTSWPTLVSHFRVKWLGAAPDTLLEIPITKLVTTTQPDAATTVSRETTTTTTMIIPAPANTAAPATYETTTMPQRHVIAPPTLIPAQSEVDLTTSTTTTDSSNTVTTAIRQDQEELAVGREEEWGEKKGVREQEVDTGEQERAEVTQGEVRDPAPSPTARVAANAKPHEPVWFNWATEVDEAHGLSPVAHNTLQPEPADPAPAPINPAPGDVAVDPVRTTFVNAVPADPVPIDPAPVSPINPVRTAPANPVSVPASPVPTEPAPTNPVPVGPDPVSPVPTDPAPANAVTIDPVRTASANAAPTQPTPVDPDPAHIVLAEPVPVDPAIALFNPMPVNYIQIRDYYKRGVLVKINQSVSCVPARPISTTPVAPVHIDPVSVTSANPNPITFIIKKLPLHQISIHLAYVKSSQLFRVRWRGFGSRTRAFAI